MVLKRSSLIWNKVSLTCSWCPTFCLYRTAGEVRFITDSSSECGGLEVVFVECVNDRLAAVARSVKRTLALSISSGERVEFAGSRSPIEQVCLCVR